MTTTNTTSKKLTKKDYFNALLAIPAVKENSDLVKFVEHELELLAKKNISNGERKPSKLQEANSEIGKVIVANMERGKGYTVAEITKVADLRDTNGDLLTTQKVSPIMNKLVEAGILIKTMEKRRSLFSLA